MTKLSKNIKNNQSKSVDCDPFFDDGEEAGEDLSPRQIRCIELLISGVPQQKVAEELNVNTATISRWKSQNPHFLSAFNRAKKANQEATESKLKTLSLTAVDVISEILTDTNLSPKLRSENAWRVLEFLNITPSDDRNLCDNLERNIKELLSKKKREKSSDEFDKLLDSLESLY